MKQQNGRSIRTRSAYTTAFLASAVTLVGACGDEKATNDKPGDANQPLAQYDATKSPNLTECAADAECGSGNCMNMGDVSDPDDAFFCCMQVCATPGSTAECPAGEACRGGLFEFGGALFCWPTCTREPWDLAICDARATGFDDCEIEDGVGFCDK